MSYRKIPNSTEEAALVMPVDQNGSVLVPGASSSSTTTQQVFSANDRTETYTYADPGTADERITTITYSSATVGKTVTDTISYAGAAGSYRPSGKTRVVS